MTRQPHHQVPPSCLTPVSRISNKPRRTPVAPVPSPWMTWCNITVENISCDLNGRQIHNMDRFGSSEISECQSKTQSYHEAKNEAMLRNAKQCRHVWGKGMTWALEMYCRRPWPTWYSDDLRCLQRWDSRVVTCRHMSLVGVSQLCRTSSTRLPANSLVSLVLSSSTVPWQIHDCKTVQWDSVRRVVTRPWSGKHQQATLWKRW